MSDTIDSNCLDCTPTIPALADSDINILSPDNSVTIKRTGRAVFSLIVNSIFKLASRGTKSASISGSGLVGNELKVDVNISKDASNALTLLSDGLFVPPSTGSGSISGISSIFGRRTPSIIATTGDYNTAQVTEDNSNLYFTPARSRAALSGTANEIGYNSATGQISWVGLAATVGGTPQNTRKKLGFVAGANVTLTPVDDPTNNILNITIASTGGGGGGASSQLGDL